MNESTDNEKTKDDMVNEAVIAVGMNKVIDIGKTVIKYRKANGMSQKHLASKIGLTSQGLHKIEKGYTSPRVSTVQQILEVLCITPNQLFGIEETDGESFDILKRMREMKE